ncbi:translocation and assembly module lipoprotein TamL [Adhaeribacter rhizoryzae]|nr:BamA/TamA family outer membrane protein [Adhaeribacter rhizoryzae]
MIGSRLNPKSPRFSYPKLTLSVLSIFCLFYLSGCSGTSKLPEGKRLYTGANVKLESKEKIKDESALSTQLAATITPKPNTSFLGIRPGLFFYNLAGTPKKKKGLRSFIKNNLGEEPVFYDSVNNEHIAALMVNRLNNAGYFNSTVGYKENVKDKTVNVTYTAQVAKPYTISSIVYPTAASDSLDQLYRDISASQAASLLKAGDNYNLATFTAERVRIDAELKNKGYFYFDPDLILFKVDTTQNNYTVNIYPTIKPEAPAKALVPYKLGDVRIYTNYTLRMDSTAYPNPPVRVQGYHYYPDEKSLKAKHLLPSVFLEKDSLYSRRDHALTVSRLMGLGLFRFVDLQLRDSDSLAQALNVNIRLTPSRLQSMRAEFEMVTKTNGFAGPGFNARYRHRNLMRGAEQLQINFNISQESQVGGNKNRSGSDTGNTETKSGINSFMFGTQAQLDMPRFMTPFKTNNLRSEFVPKTRFTLGYSYVNRVTFYQMNAYNATYGYVWRPKSRITHEITPVNLQFARLSKVGPEFQERLNQNLFLRRSFEEQFIVGSMYNFTYNTQNQQQHRNDFFFNANIDLSGNLLSLFTSKVQGQTEIPNTFVKQPFSQYSRVALEGRYYQQLTRGSRLASRIIIGAGIPYKNSETLPYIKQFFIGGSNSIRAFRPREVGPGTYSVTTDPNLQDNASNGFFDQTGDIKFEANAEYRFDIIPYLKGAVFVDAGNIWLARASADRPGGEFIFSKALSQLAVGTGAGLRIDAEFFVLRFDLGVPVRDPIQASPYVFTFPPERKSMVLHIAVGYPF